MREEGGKGGEGIGEWREEEGEDGGKGMEGECMKGKGRRKGREGMGGGCRREEYKESIPFMRSWKYKISNLAKVGVALGEANILLSVITSFPSYS